MDKEEKLRMGKASFRNSKAGTSDFPARRKIGVWYQVTPLVTD